MGLLEPIRCMGPPSDQIFRLARKLIEYLEGKQL